MVKIRLKRMGRKFNAFYRIVVADARASRDGKIIEKIGHYNPHSKEILIDLKLKDKWINLGAKPTEIVKNLIKKYTKKIQGNSKEDQIIFLNKRKRIKKQAINDQKKSSK